MLTEIICDKFRTKKITFHDSLNVILGDERATNSIGKSTLLMIIDFVFGGKTLLTYNIDIINELGHHEYCFAFTFGETVRKFKRSTQDGDLVYQCDEDYTPVDSIRLDDYTALLKTMYGISLPYLSFRAAVSLFSRIWGKGNINVTRPLHAIAAQRSLDAVNNLIKLFNEYSSIEKLTIDAKDADESLSVLKKALKRSYLPRISSRQYNDNVELINRCNNELSEIRDNLARFATNIKEISNRELVDLKQKKDDLLPIKLKLENRLKRIKNNLDEGKYLKSKQLYRLMEFFPNINIKRLSEIEEFHAGLSKILRDELRISEKNLAHQLEDLNTALDGIDKEMATVLSSIDNPNAIIDRVYHLTSLIRRAENENGHFIEREKAHEQADELRSRLKGERTEIVSSISERLNSRMRDITSLVYSEKRKSPVLKLSDDNYAFEVYEDTGTGKAYSNLVILDLAVLEMTELPFLIHDSLLFKNIENNAVSNIVLRYGDEQRQSFIAIDEIGKYGQIISDYLKRKSVIELDNDNVLFVKDWRV